ncbi:hypothetical protein V8B97DRAFT_1690891 [Scleroderma yunnanense]
MLSAQTQSSSVRKRIPVLSSMTESVGTAMYLFYQVFICLLKFDFFCFVGVTMQLLIVVLSTNSTEFGLTITAIPIVLILLAGCAYAVQREVKWLMATCLALMVAAMTYCKSSLGFLV